MNGPIPVRIIATRHEHVMSFSGREDSLRVSRVELELAPVANVDALQALMGSWWSRSGGYPVGRLAGVR